MPGRMTHLLPDDRLLMQQYLASLPSEYDHIDYDVRVGPGRPYDQPCDENIRKMAVDLSQRRIDAVCHRADRIDIVEVTLHAGIKAYGQLQIYPKLYTCDFCPTIRIVPVLVTRQVSPDIIDALNEAGVEIFIFPTPPAL